MRGHGVLEQDAAKAWYSIDMNISHYDEKKRVEMVVMPSIEYKVTTLIDFNSPVLGTQHAGLKAMRDFFETTSDWYMQIRRLPSSVLLKFVKEGQKAFKMFGIFKT